MKNFKNISILFLLLAGLVAFAGCEEEEMVGDPTGDTFTVRYDDNPSTTFDETVNAGAQYGVSNFVSAWDSGLGYFQVLFMIESGSPGIYTNSLSFVIYSWAGPGTYTVNPGVSRLEVGYGEGLNLTGLPDPATVAFDRELKSDPVTPGSFGSITIASMGAIGEPVVGSFDVFFPEPTDPTIGVRASGSFNASRNCNGWDFYNIVCP